MSISLLIADDELDVAEVVAIAARLNWPECNVILATSGKEALHSFASQPVDLVILDVTMPHPDGFEVCRRIRARSQVPILMLTVRDKTADKVRALDLGADDYLTKPFDHLELLARLRALVRRTTSSAPTTDVPFEQGKLYVNPRTQEVRVGDQTVDLTATEYRLLAELVSHAGQILSHEQLLERVWGPQYTRDSHYLKVYIQRLRQKLGDDATDPRHIETVWGRGYRLIRPQ